MLLQIITEQKILNKVWLDGEIGRRTTFKLWRTSVHEGSSPSRATYKHSEIWVR